MRITATVVPDTSMPVEVRELELAAPRAGEVLVRRHAGGVCHSDLKVVDRTLAWQSQILGQKEVDYAIEATGRPR